MEQEHHRSLTMENIRSMTPCACRSSVIYLVRTVEVEDGGVREDRILAREAAPPGGWGVLIDVPVDCAPVVSSGLWALI